MAIYAIMWHTHLDDRACKICVALDGYIWVFDTSKGDILTDALMHPVHGIVWSLTEGSNAHSRGYGSSHINNCRCFITTTITAEDILAKCTYLADIIKTTADEIDDTKGGDSRRTTFEDIGIDPSKYDFGEDV